MNSIETNASQTAGDTIASEALGRQVHSSQSGRLGQEFITVDAAEASTVADALRDAGYHAIVSPIVSPKVTITKVRTVRVPDPLWSAAQAKAAEKGETVTAVIIRSLKRYVR